MENNISVVYIYLYIIVFTHFQNNVTWSKTYVYIFEKQIKCFLHRTPKRQHTMK